MDQSCLCSIFREFSQRHVCLSVSHSIFIVVLTIILHTHPFIVCHFLCLSPYKNRFIIPSHTIGQTIPDFHNPWLPSCRLLSQVLQFVVLFFWVQFICCKFCYKFLYTVLLNLFWFVCPRIILIRLFASYYFVASSCSRPAVWELFLKVFQFCFSVLFSLVFTMFSISEPC